MFQLLSSKLNLSETQVFSYEVSFVWFCFTAVSSAYNYVFNEYVLGDESIVLETKGSGPRINPCGTPQKKTIFDLTF